MWVYCLPNMEEDLQWNNDTTGWWENYEVNISDFYQTRKSQDFILRHSCKKLTKLRSFTLSFKGQGHPRGEGQS